MDLSDYFEMKNSIGEAIRCVTVRHVPFASFYLAQTASLWKPFAGMEVLTSESNITVCPPTPRMGCVALAIAMNCMIGLPVYLK